MSIIVIFAARNRAFPVSLDKKSFVWQSLIELLIEWRTETFALVEMDKDKPNWWGLEPNKGHERVAPALVVMLALCKYTQSKSLSEDHWHVRQA